MNRQMRSMVFSDYNFRLHPIRGWLPSLLLVIFSVTGCAQGVKTGTVAANDALAQPDLQLLELSQTSGLSSIMQRLKKHRVIFVGETHDRLDHHLVQLEVLKAALAQTPDLVIGVEWFQRPFQSVLDDYIAGRIDESRMLSKTDYYTRWRFDYRLYQPVLRFAREQGVRVIALNASKELVDRVREKGLDGLDAEQRDRLPADYDRSDEAYMQRLRKVFESHPGMMERRFEHFVDVQLTWDETMAETAADYLIANPQTRMLVFAGVGHIAHGSGIPDRVQRRLPGDQASILVAETHTLEPGSADYLVLSRAQKLPRAGLMGAFLEDSEQGLRISGLSDKGALKETDVDVGDILLRIDGRPVPDFASLKLIMLGRKPGDEVALDYRHKGWLGKANEEQVTIKLR